MVVLRMRLQIFLVVRKMQIRFKYQCFYHIKLQTIQFMLRNKGIQMTQKCRRQSLRNSSSRQCVKTLENDLNNIRKDLMKNISNKQLSHINFNESYRSEDAEIVGENKYLRKKLEKKEAQVKKLKQSLEQIHLQLRNIENQRNCLMKEKLTMGIQISRLTEQNILLHNKTKLLKEKDCVIHGLQTQIQLLKRGQMIPHILNHDKQLNIAIDQFRKAEHERKLKHIQKNTLSPSDIDRRPSDQLEKYKRKHRNQVEQNNKLKFKIAELQCRNQELVKMDKQRQQQLGQKISQLEMHMKQIVSQNKFLKKKIKQSCA